MIGSKSTEKLSPANSCHVAESSEDRIGSQANQPDKPPSALPFHHIDPKSPHNLLPRSQKLAVRLLASQMSTAPLAKKSIRRTLTRKAAQTDPLQLKPSEFEVHLSTMAPLVNKVATHDNFQASYAPADICAHYEKLNSLR